MIGRPRKHFIHLMDVGERRKLSAKDVECAKQIAYRENAFGGKRFSFSTTEGGRFVERTK
jgi:hypothetical protein